MEFESEKCGRCGTLVYAFSGKLAASDNSSYCIKCAEELDREYLVKNVCSVCTRLIGKEEVKFIMPSHFYSSYFFDRLPLENRMMCTSCYRKAERLNIIGKPFVKLGQIRARIGRSIARKAIDGSVRLQ